MIYIRILQCTHRIAFLAPTICFNQALTNDEYNTKYTRQDEYYCAAPYLFGAQTFAAPAGQDYFTLAQLAAVLHSYYYRPSDKSTLGNGVCAEARMPDDKIHMSGMQEVKSIWRNSDASFGCIWSYDKRN